MAKGIGDSFRVCGKILYLSTLLTWIRRFWSRVLNQGIVCM